MSSRRRLCDCQQKKCFESSLCFLWEFISETLAGIYLAQGNYKEARNIYKKLLTIEPEKKDHFIMKIGEIEAKLSELGE